MYMYIYSYINIYIQTRPKGLKHYDFGKIIAQDSRIGFKMVDYCYHMLEGVPLNISRCIPNYQSNSALWCVHILSTQYRGVQTPLFLFLFVIFQRVSIHIVVSAIHKPQYAKDDHFQYLLGKKTVNLNLLVRFSLKFLF